MPGGIAALTSLSYLFLAANNFEAAPVPGWLSGMTNLEELSLKSLKLQGSIPMFLGSLTKMVLLDLDDNSLTGTLATELAQLSKLQFALFNRNQVSQFIVIIKDLL
jgi:Leucine-rich repeat (LRR) protein